ncbi:hypothetical protein MRB53_019261 [Persea americana]|uniref:Uncharacterized protein n=1 Tax=Persea americana TaxID=3435 RepID=A0ACC2KXK1_PERAE|nr:hypothetical protein MRB53_019261 [Persea americana]
MLIAGDKDHFIPTAVENRVIHTLNANSNNIVLPSGYAVIVIYDNSMAIAFLESSHVLASYYAKAIGIPLLGVLFPFNELLLPKHEIPKRIVQDNLIKLDGLLGMMVDDSTLVARCAEVTTTCPQKLPSYRVQLPI